MNPVEIGRRGLCTTCEKDVIMVKTEDGKYPMDLLITNINAMLIPHDRTCHAKIPNFIARVC